LGVIVVIAELSSNLMLAGVVVDAAENPVSSK
jgi:hypothetical protein